MKRKTFVDSTLRFIKKSILPLFAVLLLVIVLKQINLYNRLVNIGASCLPVLMGGVVAFLLQPFIDKLHEHFSMRTSVLLVYLGICVIGALLLFMLIPVIYRQIVDFASMLPHWLEKIAIFLKQYHISYADFNSISDTYVKEGYIVVIDSLKTTFSTITKYGIAYITGFFISIDLVFWKRTAKKIVPNVQQFATFYKTMSTIVYQYLIGTLLDMLFIAISVGVVLYVGGFPNAILYALILALLNLFPYVGATLGLVMIGIVGALSYEQFPIVVFLIVWSIQQLESNFIQPMIFNRTMNVRPILTFVFIFISEALFGIVGIVLSPIFAAIAQIAFRSYLHSKTCDSVGEWDEIWRDFDEVMSEESYDSI